MHLPESTVIEDIYDHIFKNTDLQFIDFCEDFPASWIDNDNATIYLAKNEGISLFKIKIERA
jgi:hypothetical protein